MSGYILHHGRGSQKFLSELERLQEVIRELCEGYPLIPKETHGEYFYAMEIATIMGRKTRFTIYSKETRYSLLFYPMVPLSKL